MVDYMAHLRTIILLAFLALRAYAQPFTQSELAWPQHASVSTSGAGCDVMATNSAVIIAENIPGTIHLHGGINGNVTYSIASSPTHGTLSALSGSAGTVLYTPTANYSGSDFFTFQVTSNACVTNAAVYISVIATNSLTPTCMAITNVGFIDSDTFLCATWTLTPPGTTTTVCTTNETAQVSPVTGNLCAAIACLTPTDTNAFSFSLASTNYDNIAYTNWTICNPNNFSVTYKTFGVYSYTNSPTNSFVYMQITTNGTVSTPGAGSVGTISILYPTDPTVSSAGIVYSNGFTVGPNVFNLPVYIRVLLNKSPIDAGSPPSFSGVFTNSFQ